MSSNSEHRVAQVVVPRWHPRRARSAPVPGRPGSHAVTPAHAALRRRRGSPRCLNRSAHGTSRSAAWCPAGPVDAVPRRSRLASCPAVQEAAAVHLADRLLLRPAHPGPGGGQPWRSDGSAIRAGRMYEAPSTDGRPARLGSPAAMHAAAKSRGVRPLLVSAWPTQEPPHRRGRQAGRCHVSTADLAAASGYRAAARSVERPLRSAPRRPSSRRPARGMPPIEDQRQAFSRCRRSVDAAAPQVDRVLDQLADVDLALALTDDALDHPATRPGRLAPRHREVFTRLAVCDQDDPCFGGPAESAFLRAAGVRPARRSSAALAEPDDVAGVRRPAACAEQDRRGPNRARHRGRPAAVRPGPSEHGDVPRKIPAPGRPWVGLLGQPDADRIAWPAGPSGAVLGQPGHSSGVSSPRSSSISLR